MNRSMNDAIRQGFNNRPSVADEVNHYQVSVSADNTELTEMWRLSTSYWSSEKWKKIFILKILFRKKRRKIKERKSATRETRITKDIDLFLYSVSKVNTIVVALYTLSFENQVTSVKKMNFGLESSFSRWWRSTRKINN